MEQPPEPAKFDAHAPTYDELHQESVKGFGEPIEYFARHKIECLAQLGLDRQVPMLDYGCGVGNVTRQLVTAYDSVIGYDPSEKSLDLARQRVTGASFTSQIEEVPDGHFGAAVLSGVLHHVPPQERVAVLARVRKKLRQGGKVVIFEHNPWNPATRRVVKMCPFDDDAILVWPRELRRLVSESGFARVELDYILFFPRILARLRPLERHLRRVFLGGQTMTVGVR